MNTNILHITNGDVTTHLLKKLGYKGEIITWREMLCEGKTTTDVGSEGFWKSRFDFFSKQYKITKQQFIDYTLKEFRNLCSQKTQQEIVLWFEYDLFCQVNMLAVISWLKKFRPDVPVSLVCSGKEDDSGKLYGLSELRKDKLETLFENRVSLSIDDIEYADYIWQLYCSDSPLALQNHTRVTNTQFNYLPQAIAAHIERFPTIKNGLNKIENTILEQVANNEFENKNRLVNKLLVSQGLYGFGDIQYFKKIKDLNSLFKGFSPVRLNDLGFDILQKRQNYYPSIKDDSSYLGGTLKYNYLYNEIDGKLLKL